MTTKEFNKLSLQKRHALLKKEGEFIGSRLVPGYRVHLFGCRGYFMEMWVLIGIDQVRWIEIQTNKGILNEYADRVDLRDVIT
jgi:hypothetical protein